MRQAAKHSNGLAGAGAERPDHPLRRLHRSRHGMTARAPYQGSPEWYAERRTGYGASDAPILIQGDEGAWRQLHGEKLGLLPDRAGTETMNLGKELEATILKIGAEREGWRVRRVNHLVRHPDLGYVFASLDGRKIGDRRPIEVKKWAVKGDDWGPAGSDIVPVRILYQLQQQAAVTGADAVEVIVLFGGSKVERFTVGRDASMIDEILGLETAAWAYVQRGEMPPWPGEAPRRIVLAVDEIEVDDTLRNLVEIHETAAAQAKRAEQELEDAKNRLRAALADAGAAKGLMPDGSRVSITHRPQDPRATTDWKLVAAALKQRLTEVIGAAGPEFYDLLPDDIEAMFTTTAKPRRDLRVTVRDQKETARNAA
jgi:putative phage-type endonuclease